MFVKLFDTKRIIVIGISFVLFLLTGFYFQWSHKFWEITIASTIEFRVAIALGYFVLKVPIVDSTIIALVSMFLLTVIIEPFLGKLVSNGKNIYSKYLKQKVDKKRMKIVFLESRIQSLKKKIPFLKKCIRFLGQGAFFLLLMNPFSGVGSLIGIFIAHTVNISYGKALFIIFSGCISSAIIIALTIYFGKDLLDIIQH